MKRSNPCSTVISQGTEEKPGMNSGSAEELVDLAVLTPCQPKRNHRDIKTCKARFSHSTISLLRFLSLTMTKRLATKRLFFN